MTSNEATYGKVVQDLLLWCPVNNSAYTYVEFIRVVSPCRSELCCRQLLSMVQLVGTVAIWKKHMLCCKATSLLT
ncbi:hypothetical protein VNO78_14951 [Psophocarpus tetragonolobus]|uniref:Uncharacterized protein n=1 Tax=Psophocarpus tetragonolobus TaxID=3891 RepID=A0AAN9XJG5_PSOTE